MPVELTVNGAGSGGVQLRITMIGLSIRSAWRNPDAMTHRAVARSLQTRGHYVTFFEERLNEAISGEYREEGSAPLRAFDEEYPDLHVRSYDPPPRRELGVWLGQIASAHDLLILLRGHSSDLLPVFEKLQAPHVVRLIERQGEAASVLEDLESGTVVTRYHPPEEGANVDDDPAAATARAIEQAWIAAGIRF